MRFIITIYYYIQDYPVSLEMCDPPPLHRLDSLLSRFLEVPGASGELATEPELGRCRPVSDTGPEPVRTFEALSGSS